MNHVVVELLKAAFIAAIFASVSAELRLFATPMSRPLKLSLAGFLGTMLVPLTYLYLSLAFPAAAASLLPVQRLSIWLYGPFLLAFMHALVHVPITRSRVAVYFGPAVVVIFIRSSDRSLDGLSPLWELMGLIQAGLMALAACTWAYRRRNQLRILVTAFSSSTFQWVLRLCVGLLALLGLDVYIHALLWRDGSIVPLMFYSLTTACALYSIGVSTALVWRLGSIDPGASEAVTEEQVQSNPPVDLETEPRKLELTREAATDLERELACLVRDQKIHTRNDLYLAELARELRVSTHIASELLNQHMGTSFYEFLSNHRASEAAALLADPRSSLSVADIAYEAGFNNSNTFYREFKRRFGVTPAQYRKDCRSDRASTQATDKQPSLISDLE